VAVLAEGILDRLDPDSSDILKNCPRDELGRITYSEIELGDVILPDLHVLCQEAGIDIAMKTKDIGYELRCARPIAFDLEYTKFLGYGAVRHLLDGKTGIVVTRDYDNLGFETLESIAVNGKMLSRTVSLTSDFYLVGRSFMIR
jgi:6-phosphofructokinase 1